MNAASVAHLDPESPEFAALAARLRDPQEDPRSLMLDLLLRLKHLDAVVPDVDPIKTPVAGLLVGST